MYEHSHDPWTWSIRKPLSDDQLYSNFCFAVNQRLTKDDLNTEKNYKVYSSAKDNFNMMSANNGNREYSKVWQFIKGNIENGTFNQYMSTRDFLSDDYMEYIEDYIERYILPYIKKPALKKYIKAVETVFTEIPIQEESNLEEVIYEEPVFAKPKSNAGRPKGSKNKKQSKEIYFPIHKVGTINGNIDIDCLVKAIADLVWRKEGQIDSFYIHNLIMSDSHKNYVNYLFMKSKSTLENKYWKIEKKGKANILVPKIKRSGYYGKANDSFDLFSLTYISEQKNIPKNTLIYRLKHMSIKEAVKNPGE